MPTKHVVQVQATGVDETLVQPIARAVTCVLEMQVAQPYEVGVRLVSAEEIRRLNREYRSVDEVTDVLSFAHEEGTKLRSPRRKRRYLGDLAICVDRALQQAQEFETGVDRELAYLAVHGTLHLLGFDHVRDDERHIMRAEEERVLGLLSLPLPKVRS